MMQQKCAACGAPLTGKKGKPIVCAYCGTQYMPGEKTYQPEDAEKAGYDFERGRQRATEEAREKEQRVRESVAKKMARQEEERRREDALRKPVGCGTIVLWIFFYPIMMTLALLRTHRLKPLIRISLLVIFWGLFLAPGYDFFSSIHEVPWLILLLIHGVVVYCLLH